ncbi:TIGR03086 family metal-binding protein [Actinacidiphila bryophytorum]|uniref:TIGR03086 family metal-binding protein n=1 Tax=Actinacidiphila bryophytorum TaxID=1436133 RepID=UPI002176A74C|nr:TIGR03086 family metal-binding protein [Actinacidiphila bryophytorum]UWE10726.1 TIGR03086 family metal-binding protein [Actinacidiphila bryophytorum]
MAAVTAQDSTVRLLEQAVAYGLGCVDQVPPGGLRLPTPCRGWNLDALLCHLYESVCALREAAEYGEVALLPAAGPPADPVAAVRGGAVALLESWQARACPEVSIGGMAVPGATVAFIGVVELAVHGWDIAQACGSPRPIPVPLALAILRRAPMITGGADLFAAPVPVSPLACPGDRLVALLGRTP